VPEKGNFAVGAFGDLINFSQYKKKVIHTFPQLSTGFYGKVLFKPVFYLLKK